MRHRVSGRKLGRTSAHRKALYRNLVTSLLEHERVQTTDAKAKEVRRLAERMITLGKRGSLAARRRALRVIRHRAVAAKVFDDLAERYRGRPGGYTRVVQLRRRIGDAALISIVELVEGEASRKGAGSKESSKKRAAGADRSAKKAAARGKAAAKQAKPEKRAPAKKAAAKKAPVAKKASKKAASKKATAKKAASKKKTAKKSSKKKTRARKSDA